MLNHARTLLMNVDGTSSPVGFADELVDPGFRSLPLPTPLQTVRVPLFGGTPDRHMLNYRCRQLLALTHATPLGDYLTALDRRVTYDFRDTTLVPDTVWGSTVTKYSSVGSLTVFGDPEPPDGTGKLYHSHVVTTPSAGLARVERTVSPIQFVEIEFEAGDRVPLAGSGRTARLSSAAAGQRYWVKTYSRPTSDLSALADAASNLGEPVYDYLFGVTREEPYQTFRQLWFRSRELPLRLGALVCGLVYRTEAVRRG